MKIKKIINRQKIGNSILIPFLSLSLLACAGKFSVQDSNRATSSGITATTSSTISTTNNSVSGIIVSNSESTPLVGITVYIADSPFVSQEGARNKIGNATRDLTLNSIGPDLDSRSCRRPQEPYITYTCTNYWGAFYLNIANLRSLPLRLRFTNQRNTQEILLSLNDLGANLGNIKFSDIPSNGPGINKQKIAIVTDLLNPYKEIQNTLDTNDIDLDNMRLEITEGFYELYDVDKETSLIEFPSFDALFADKDQDEKADINNYEVVYINSLEEADIASLSDEYKRMLIEYVAKGGELYITSWSFELQEPGIESYI